MTALVLKEDAGEVFYFVSLVAVFVVVAFVEEGVVAVLFVDDDFLGLWLGGHSLVAEHVCGWIFSFVVGVIGGKVGSSEVEGVIGGWGLYFEVDFFFFDGDIFGDYGVGGWQEGIDAAFQFFFELLVGE